MTRTKAPFGCYWRGKTLWGRLRAGGQNRQISLRTNDPTLAAKRYEAFKRHGTFEEVKRVTRSAVVTFLPNTVKRFVGIVAERQEEKTRSVVYFIAHDGGDFVKIGHARSLKDRLAAIQVGSPQELKVVATIKGGQKLERLIHTQFAHLRQRGEWFRLDSELSAFIEAMRSGIKSGDSQQSKNEVSL